MKTSKKGIDLIKRWEGCKLEAYPDPASELFKACLKNKINPYDGGYKKIIGWAKLKAAPWTIGVGHTGADVKAGTKITMAQAEKLLLANIVKFEQDINKLVKAPLTQNQFDALVCFVYNLGPETLKRSTMLQLINNKRYELAALQFERFCYAGGKILSGLQKRRKEERILFETP